MGISLGDQQAHCLSNLRFADDVPLLSTLLNQLKKMMSDFKKKHRESGSEDSSAQNENSLQRNVKQTNGSKDRRHQCRDVTIKRACKVPGTNRFVRASRNNRNEEQNPRCLGIVCHM